MLEAVGSVVTAGVVRAGMARHPPLPSKCAPEHTRAHTQNMATQPKLTKSGRANAVSTKSLVIVSPLFLASLLLKAYTLPDFTAGSVSASAP